MTIKTTKRKHRARVAEGEPVDRSPKGNRPGSKS